MATALQQQLAAIAANSTHQLDLKAQKTRHSKSLLFEPRDAASQNFDTIFQICYEGFEELCMLDSRFTPYARTLFSEQSKNADRTQMTAHENEELDRTIKSFLGLVCGRLLLKPAMKAVEWLVRRFAAHENETEWILLTFLPYHTSHIFPTLLSILPETLPGSFRFLHPYVAALQSPPRHAVLAAAISNQGLFSGLSDYVLKTARAKNHSAVLLGFWASITAQAVNGLIDSTRSGRESIRKQREEDLLLRILPILQSALSIKDVPELYLGSCMIMTILATKAALEDKVLDAMMESVAIGWAEQTIEDGLICLSVMAEEKEQIQQPRAVTRALLRLEEPSRMLDELSDRHRTDKLILATCLGALTAASKSSTSGLEFAKAVIDRQLLSEPYLIALAEDVLLRIKAMSDSDEHAATRDSLITGLSELMADESMAVAIRKAANDSNIDLSQLSAQLAIEPAHSDVAMRDGDDDGDESDAIALDDMTESDKQKVDGVISLLEETDSKRASFFDIENHQAVIDMNTSFHSLASAEQPFRQFLEIDAPCKESAMDTPTFLSSLATVWVGRGFAPVQARSRALEAAAQVLRKSDRTKIDFQALLPYVVVGLADSSQRVRKSAAALLLEFVTKSGTGSKIWCKDSIYNSNSGKLFWLSSIDGQALLESAILPVLEDCVLDGSHILQSLTNALNGVSPAKPASVKSEQKSMKSTTRASVCAYLASHVTLTTSAVVKLRLLEVLKGVGKTAGDARKTVLLPFVNEWRTLPSEQIELLCMTCSSNDASEESLDKAILGSLSHRSPDELQALKSIAAGEVQSRNGLPTTALACLRKLWSSMKTPSQTALADFLLDLIVEGVDVESSDPVQAEALETFRNLKFSSDVLAYLVESLPNTVELQEQTPPNKRRRTSKSENILARPSDPAKLKSAIKKVTVVLEVVESSKPAHHPQLLKGLFHLLGELHHYKTLMGSQLVYLQELLMGCLLSVVNGLKGGASADIDRSVVRADLIVECVRTTTSTQVHNTALLLISNLATWAPDLVLHSVMPLFTFMSTTLLRQSDEYSAHVTDQTVARIVPPLAASLKKKGKDLVSGAAELLLSFTAAFEHIPLHRRAGLFQHLVETLGAKEVLFAVVAMLLERYPEDSRMIDFTTDLMSSFPVVVQLQTFKQYMALVFDCLKKKRSLSDTILGFSEKDADQIEESVDTLLESLSGLLQSHSLRKRLAKELGKEGEDTERLQNIYADLLEQVMQLSRDLASNEELKDSVDSVLAALLALTPTKDFIESSAKLMQTGSDQTRQQVFRSLEARVADAKRGNATLQQVYIDVLPNCCVFIHEDQPVATRRCAITCIDQIVDKYGKTDRAATLDAARQVAGASALGGEDASLRVIAILCLASMVEVLGDDFIAILPQVLNKIFDYLDETIAAPLINAGLHSAAFSFATAVLDHIPWMMSSQYLDRAMELAARSAASKQSHTIGSEAEDFCLLAARKVEAQEFFDAANRTALQAYNLGPEAADQHLTMISAAVQHHNKATIAKCSQTVLSILETAFRMREIFADAPVDDNTEAIYAQVNSLGLSVVLKLNDATFRPFFIRWVEGATANNSSALPKSRLPQLISLYNFTHLLFDELKSIVTSYASFVLDNAATILNTMSIASAEDQKTLYPVLSTLAASFRHDQDDFWQAPAHFEAIASPLLHQLSLAPSTPASTLQTHLLPTITELAAAASSPDHHKSLNTGIMKCMRHDSAAVRLAAVQCERAITTELGFDWLSLLPEMLPFISELQEDDSEDVERETLRWVAQIEGVTGESLEGMLQ
ncbi:Hypothetical protein R9X50_00644600 [Acrodontium crateriforme]|uniref:U3 small nucleolar RNA-associated protein 10 n=1 Tax=Acrodontium crateriforme TaxID=150365 RepID=A0AAQ3M960_9PEZI|nr:Hypothetical protein R9X50_00644600 [Acrodontium crateriforme]